MAKYGVLKESDNFIASMINRAGVSDLEVAGGSPVLEGACVSGDNELCTLGAYVTADKRVGVAFNPSNPKDASGYPERSADDRTYINRIGDVIDYFFPTVGIEFGVQLANITGEVAPVVGKFLECTNGTLLYTIKDAQTVNVPSFEVIRIEKDTYPTGDFQSGEEPVYIVKTRFNG